MENFSLVRCDSLDAGSGCDKGLMTPTDQMTFDSEDSDPAANLEPSPAELAQCEAEMGTLLSIITELNKTMGSLKAPSEPGDLRPSGSCKPLVPDLLSHQLDRSSPERNAASLTSSKPPLTGRGGAGVVWTKLQEVLTSVEDSISSKRSWAAPITASDQDKHQEHLRAAQESWVKATQILDDMEREFGISCPSGFPKDQYQEDTLNVDPRNLALRSILQSHQEEMERSQSTFSQLEEERSNVGDPPLPLFPTGLVGLHKAWRSGSCSPYHSSAGALSPDWSSPPFPGSPLLHRRTARAAAPLSAGGDGLPRGSTNSCSPCSSPISQESETERLHRCIERLKAKNERLTAALERKKLESKQIIITLSRLEADCCALQMAVRKCEECEEAYSELLSLCDAKTQQSIPLQKLSAEAAGDRQQINCSSAPVRKLGAEELSTSFSTAGVKEETQSQSHTGQRKPELLEREAVLRQKIECLKKDRVVVGLPKLSPGVEGKRSPKSGPQAGFRGGHATDGTKAPDTKREKTSLFYELFSVREELTDLRGLICHKEKKLRCLEWSLMSQNAQEVAGAFDPESLREELEECKSEQQKLCENAAKMDCDGDVARSGPIFKELKAVLQREQALKKRLALVQDSLNTALSDSSTHRRDSGEQIAHLTQAHSKALSSYRQIRRKYREQVWRLEQKMAAMTEGHQFQSGAPKAAGETVEYRREETVL